MTTFQQRLGLGVDHERAVERRLGGEVAGASVVPFGQAMLPASTRDRLRLTPSPIRWLPDLLVVTPHRALLVDAKAGRADTPNYAIEWAALVAHRRLERSGLDVVIVWSDFTWSLPRELHPADGQPGPFIGNGSGTPFVLFTKRIARPWAELIEELAR